jgi:LCP family protein required for cell wall assembly
VSKENPEPALGAHRPSSRGQPWDYSPPGEASEVPPRRQASPGRRPRQSLLARWRGLSRLAKFGLASVSIFSALIMVIGLIGFGMYLKLDSNLHMTKVGGLTGRSSYGAQNILILSSQTRNGQGNGFGYDPSMNLSDNLFLVHLNASHTAATVVSIPGDTMVYEPACKSRLGDHGVPAQPSAIIDGAMNVGGPTCAVATVEHLTQFPMDHFVEFDFNSFQTMVNTLGGVEVCFPQAVSNLHLSAGRHLITGSQALTLLQTHGADEGSNLGRIALQQQFFSSLIQKLEGEGVLGNVLQLLDIANTATQALTVDPGLGPIAMVRLAETLRHLHAGDVNFITMPTIRDPANDHSLLPEEPEDDMLWEMLQTNTPWHGHLPALPASSVDVTVLNGTGTAGLGARTAARLRQLGFRVSAVGQAPHTSSTTVSYHGLAQAGGAYTLMRALRQTPDSVNDGASGRLTLTLGADFAGIGQLGPTLGADFAGIGQLGPTLSADFAGIGQPQHVGRGRAHTDSAPAGGQQPVAPGQSGDIESRNAGENLCTATPDVSPGTGGP